MQPTALGAITKAARNRFGNKLDATKRSQLLFMDRDDILKPLCRHEPTAPKRSDARWR
jgi:hypothetical protein